MSDNKKPTDLKTISQNSDALIKEAVKRHIEETEKHDPRYVNGSIVLLKPDTYNKFTKALEELRSSTDSFYYRQTNEIRQELKVAYNLLNEVEKYLKAITDFDSEKEKESTIERFIILDPRSIDYME